MTQETHKNETTDWTYSSKVRSIPYVTCRVSFLSDNFQRRLSQKYHRLSGLGEKTIRKRKLLEKKTFLILWISWDRKKFIIKTSCIIRVTILFQVFWIRIGIFDTLIVLNSFRYFEHSYYHSFRPIKMPFGSFNWVI